MSSPAISLSLNSYASIIAARLSAAVAATSTAASSSAAAASGATTTLATASTQSGGIILSATPSPNAASPAQSALMELNANSTGSSLTNTLLGSTSQQLQSMRALPAELLKPQVIEALVLKSTLLATPNSGGSAPSTPTQPAAPATTPPTTPAGNSQQAAQQQAAAQAKVELAWQGRTLQLLSAQPLPVGTQVRIEVTARGELKLLPPQLANTANTPTSRPSEPALPPPLQQSLRESLPRQRPLADLQPLLQRLLSPAVLPKLPAPVASALQQLTATMPKPQQLQSAEGVRQAVSRSGNFLEAKVTAATTPSVAAVNPKSADGSASTATNPRAAAPGRADAIPSWVPAIGEEASAGDIKAQLVQLVALIKRFAPAAPTTTAEQLPDQLYSARPPIKSAPNDIPNGNADSEMDQLQQLSRVLQGGLARIQVNQLESAGSRAVGTADGQPPQPSWSFELPISTARGTDTLQLRIEQQAQQQGASAHQMQWRVQLAFDLHELGKMAATLTVSGGNVSATLWAEQQHTHHVVRTEVDHFRAALEGVGVRVTELQCRLGLPPAEKHRWQQQLVDVRT